MTKEDLMQLSELIDAKLDAKFDEKLTPIYNRLDNIDRRLDKVEQRLDKVEQRLDNVEQRLDNLEESVAQLREDSVITRDAVNSLCEWAESVASFTQIRFPVSDKNTPA